MAPSFGNGPITKKPADESEDWQLTLADMFTLLLCFFVLIAAISTVDKNRYAEVADSMEAAMGTGRTRAQQHRRPKIKQADLQEIKRQLELIIGHETKSVQLELRPDGVAVNLTGGLFFQLGRAELTPLAHELLGRIADTLLNIPYRVTVEGHTDNIPIKSSRFPSNWELSSSRASAVARLIIDHGFPKTSIKVMGLADTTPIYPNEDENGQPIPDNQALNRRVVILVTP